MQMLPNHLLPPPHPHTSYTSFHFHMITVGRVPPGAPGSMGEHQVTPEPAGAGPALPSTRLKAEETADNLPGRCLSLK